MSLHATYDHEAQALYIHTSRPVSGRKRYTETEPFGIAGMNWDWEEDPAGEGNDALLGIEVLLSRPLEVHGDSSTATSNPTPYRFIQQQES